MTITPPSELLLRLDHGPAVILFILSLWQYYDILIVLIFQYVSYNHHLHISSTQMCLEEAERMFFLRHLLWPGDMFSLFGDHRAWCSTLKLEQCLIKTTSAWFGGFKDFCAILRHAKTLNMSSRSSTSISFRPISNMFRFLLVLHSFFVQTQLSWPLPYRGRPLGVASCMIFSWSPGTATTGGIGTGGTWYTWAENLMV